MSLSFVLKSAHPSLNLHSLFTLPVLMGDLAPVDGGASLSQAPRGQKLLTPVLSHLTNSAFTAHGPNAKLWAPCAYEPHRKPAQHSQGMRGSSSHVPTAAFSKRKIGLSCFQWVQNQRAEGGSLRCEDILIMGCKELPPCH